MQIIIFILILYVGSCGVFLSHHYLRVTACPTFSLLADLSKVIRMLLKNNCKCQLPLIISRKGNPTMKLPESLLYFQCSQVRIYFFCFTSESSVLSDVIHLKF